MATVRVNPPPHPTPTSVEIVTGPKDHPEEDRIVLAPRGSGPTRNGYEIDYIHTPRGGAHYDTRVRRFWLNADDMRAFVLACADMIGLEFVDHA